MASYRSTPPPGASHLHTADSDEFPAQLHALLNVLNVPIIVLEEDEDTAGLPPVVLIVGTSHLRESVARAYKTVSRLVQASSAAS